MPSALVIGGGPAGSVAAALLASGGWAVTLVEQHRFPRDKVCGECLSALGANVLHQMRLLEALLSLGAVRLGRTLLHSPSGVCAAAPLPRPMWGVSRVALDGLLLHAAARAGAQVLQPARCEGVAGGSRPSIRIRDLVTNTVDQYDADVVLVADGKSAFLDGGVPPPTGDLGIKAHFENVDGPRDAIELFGLHGSYGGLAPIEGGRWNAALSVPALRVRPFKGDLSALFGELIEENVNLRRRLRCAVRIGGWVASPVPRFAVRPDWPENVIPLGNAAAAIEPIGGEGMGLAMRSAQMVADALLSGENFARIRQRFAALWRTRGAASRGSSLVASSRRCADAFAPLLRAAPLLLRPALSLVGK